MPLSSHSEVFRQVSWRRVAACVAIVCLAAHLAGRFRVPISASTTVQINSAKAKIQHLENDAVRWFPPAVGSLFSLSSAPAPRVPVEKEPEVPSRFDDCLYNRPPPRA